MLRHYLKMSELGPILLPTYIGYGLRFSFLGVFFVLLIFLIFHWIIRTFNFSDDHTVRWNKERHLFHNNLPTRKFVLIHFLPQFLNIQLRSIIYVYAWFLWEFNEHILRKVFIFLLLVYLNKNKFKFLWFLYFVIWKYNI